MNLPFTRWREALLIALLILVACAIWYGRSASQVRPPDSPPTQPRPTPGATNQSSDQQPAPAQVPTYQLTGELSVASINLKAPLIYVDKPDEAVFQQALEHGVVRYPGSAAPGTIGNLFIFGHSSDYKYRAGSYKKVFAALPKVSKGDKVIVTDTSGISYIYIVTGSAVVAPDDTQYLSQTTGGKKLLTLQTSYPIGTALKRYLVFAELTSP